jgi:hypothetical protein
MSKPKLIKWQLYWSLTGQKIGIVEASTERDAIRKSPLPYRKYQHEVYGVSLEDEDKVNPS